MLEARIAIYVTLATVLIGFITAILGWRNTRSQLSDIHILVNSNYTAITKRVEQLVATLHDNGIDIPAAPSGD